MKRDVVESGIFSVIVVSISSFFLPIFGALIFYKFETTGLSVYLLIIGILFLIFSPKIVKLLYASKRQQGKMYASFWSKDEKKWWVLWFYRTGPSFDLWFVRVIGLGLASFSICVLCGLI